MMSVVRVFNFFLYIILFMLNSACTAGFLNSISNQKISLESKLDGTGVGIESLNTTQHDSRTLYAIERSAAGDFIEAIAVDWVLEGDIGTLTPSPSKTSATFSATKSGTGTIKLLKGENVVTTIPVTVDPQINTIKTVNVSNITSNSFDVEVITNHSLISTDSATMYYCNNTKVPNCDPKNWYSLSMTKGSDRYTISTPTFKYPDDPTDEINITLSLSFESTTDERTQTVTLDGPTQIYRSIGVGSTSALETRTSSGTNEATLTNSIISFTNPVANNIGVGDTVVVDTNSGAAGFEQVFFIRKRIDNNNYLLNDSEGAQLTSDYTVLDWQIYRAYTSVADSDSLNENTGIPLEVRDFDSSRDAVANNRAWHFAFYADAIWSLSAKHDIGSWNISGDNFLRYFVPFLPTHVGVTQRHNGSWDNTKATCSLSGTADYQWCFMQRQTGKNAVRIEGFQFDINSNGYASIVGVRIDDYNLSSNAYTYIQNNIFRSSSGGTAISSVIGTVNVTLFISSNIVYNFGYTAIGAEGTNSVVSHNTSFNNGTNFRGYNSTGSSNFTANISHSSSSYEFRGSFTGSSDYNAAENTSAPGSNSLSNVTLGNLSFVSTTPGSENLCTTSSSVAHLSGPRMIDESDPYKIYYDAAGKLRTPNDSLYPIGACTSN